MFLFFLFLLIVFFRFLLLNSLSWSFWILLLVFLLIIFSFLFSSSRSNINCILHIVLKNLNCLFSRRILSCTILPLWRSHDELNIIFINGLTIRAKVRRRCSRARSRTIFSIFHCFRRSLRILLIVSLIRRNCRRIGRSCRGFLRIILCICSINRIFLIILKNSNRLFSGWVLTIFILPFFCSHNILNIIFINGFTINTFFFFICRTRFFLQYLINIFIFILRIFLKNSNRFISCRILTINLPFFSIHNILNIILKILMIFTLFLARRFIFIFLAFKNLTRIYSFIYFYMPIL